MKDLELELISEMIKNSRRSDRELAKSLHVSQPTVTRTRTRLEKEGLIEYSAIPDLPRLGYKIIAVVFGKRDYEKHPEINIQKASDFAKRHPNIIFGATGNGLGYDRISISLHKDYSEYHKFVQDIHAEWQGIMSVSSFLIDLTSKDVIQPFSVKHFAESLTKDRTK